MLPSIHSVYTIDLQHFLRHDPAGDLLTGGLPRACRGPGRAVCLSGDPGHSPERGRLCVVVGGLLQGRAHVAGEQLHRADAIFHEPAGYTIAHETPNAATLCGGSIKLLGVLLFNHGASLFQKRKTAGAD